MPQDEYTLDDYEDEEDRLIAQGGMGIPIDENGNPRPLLPAIEPVHVGRKCLVLDLDETLLHSSFKVGRLASKYGRADGRCCPRQITSSLSR